MPGPYALTALQRVAAGQETTPGTAVAPSRIVPHMRGSTFVEDEARNLLPEARGVRVGVTDVVTQRMSQLELQQQLDADLTLPVFLAGLASVVPTGAGPYAYGFAPGAAAAAEKAAFSWEVTQSDGSTDHVRRRFGHARPTSMAINFADGQVSQLNSTWMGEAATAVAERTALNRSLPASRRIIPTGLWGVSLDDAWDDLGDTEAANVRGLSWEFTTGLTPSHHLRARPNLDMDGWYEGEMALALTLTLDLDAEAAAEILHWRNGDLRFARLEATSGADAARRALQIDQAVRIIGSPNLLGQNDQHSVVELACELRADEADLAEEFFRVEVTSGLPMWSLAAPGVPTALAVAADGSTILRATWAAPADGGAVRNYRVRYRQGAGQYTEIDAGQELTVDIPGLTASTTYQVQVRAENSADTSAWAVAVEGTTDA